MDNIDNIDNIDNNDYVRPPEPTKKEKLIDSDYYPFNIDNDNDDNLIKILKLSKSEFDLMQEEKEKEMLKIISMDREKRLNIFKSIKQQINKILVFDKPNIGTYETILSIIEMYENEYIVTYETDINHYNKIFNTIKSLRTNKDEFDALQRLILLK